MKFVKNGYYMIGDSEAKIFSLKQDTFHSLMERYSRWYMDSNETPKLSAYLHNIKASLNPMMKDGSKSIRFTISSIFIDDASFSIISLNLNLFEV